MLLPHHELHCSLHDTWKCSIVGSFVRFYSLTARRHLWSGWCLCVGLKVPNIILKGFFLTLYIKYILPNGYSKNTARDHRAELQISANSSGKNMTFYFSTKNILWDLIRIPSARQFQCNTKHVLWRNKNKYLKFIEKFGLNWSSEESNQACVICCKFSVQY